MVEREHRLQLGQSPAGVLFSRNNVSVSVKQKNSFFSQIAFVCKYKQQMCLLSLFETGGAARC